MMEAETADSFCRLNPSSIICVQRFMGQNAEVIGGLLVAGYLGAVLKGGNGISIKDVGRATAQIADVLKRHSDERRNEFASKVINKLGLALN